MNKIALAVSLLMMSTLCVAENDIWSNLFKDKLNEAGNGDSEAQYDVGTMYQNGRGVAPDRNKAVEWYQKAAAQNNTRAASRLKLMTENEARFGKTLAQAGKGDAESLYDLGNMYMMGVGADINYGKAIQAFEQSANQGNDKAAYKLGLMYYEGTGVGSNSKLALKWFSMAADHNYPAAQYYVGKMYAEGKGMRRDNGKALEWLTRAVDGGFEQARGEMINASENLGMEKTASRASEETPAAPAEAKAETAKVEQKTIVAKAQPEKPASTEKAAATTSKPDRKAATASKAEKQQAGAKPATIEYQLEDLMHGAWSRDQEPVAYLPSSINNCRTEGDRMTCYSDDQTNKTGSNIIRFKTKAIVEKFRTDGSFSVTYRNLVLDATPITGTDVSNGEDGTAAYPVKTGWGSPHTLECKFSNGETLSCVKNNTYAMTLTSPRTLASGK